MKPALLTRIATSLAFSALGIMGLAYLVIKDRFEREPFKREMHH